MKGRGGRSGDAGRVRKRKAATSARTRRAALGILADISEILLPHVESALQSGELLPPVSSAAWEGFGKDLEKALANVRAAYGKGPK